MLPSNWFEISACKGCEYGERVTSGVFCAMTQGLVPVGYQGCKAQHDFYEEQYKRRNGMTLTELAIELMKIFKFKYLTVSDTNGCCINVWKYFKPEWNDSDGEWIGCYLAFDIYPDELICKLDFSEYVDADGDVDFSKCIVEVE